MATDTIRWIKDMTLGFDPARICEYPLVTSDSTED